MYKRQGDGWRDLPDGRPFTLSMGSTPTTRDRERDELWKLSIIHISEPTRPY